MRYRFYKHTADAKFRAYGTTLEEAFSNAALAMTSILHDPQKVKPAITKTITVNGNDEKALLYRFLEEFLFLLDTEGFIVHEVHDLKISDGVLKAELRGDKAKHYKTTGDIKAVTYNEMEIGKTKDTFYVQVVVDI